MEIRFHYDDLAIAAMQERMRVDRATDLAREGLELLDWASRQISQGRELYADDKGGNRYVYTDEVLYRSSYPQT